MRAYIVIVRSYHCLYVNEAGVLAARRPLVEEALRRRGQHALQLLAGLRGAIRHHAGTSFSRVISCWHNTRESFKALP